MGVKTFYRFDRKTRIFSCFINFPPREFALFWYDERTNLFISKYANKIMGHRYNFRENVDFVVNFLVKLTHVLVNDCFPRIVLLN